MQFLFVFVVSVSQVPAQENDKSTAQGPVFTFTVQILSPQDHVDFKPFISSFPEVLRRNWISKIHELPSASEKGIVLIRFSLNRNGTLATQPVVEVSSGYSILDETSLSTIKVSEPFQNVPPDLKSTSLDLRCTFRYGVLPDGPYKSLFESAQRASAIREYASAAQIMEALLAKDPDYTNAWSYLGWIYIQLARYDKAVLALKNAIQANPFDGFAYNNLGYSLEKQKKYDQAIPQYLKQIEINHRDRSAHANLGRLYVTINESDKALPELELAATLTPNDPYLYFNLGRAYGKTNQLEKSVQAFQRSVEIEPIPQRWNWVAYEMAEEKLDLPLAQRYAELAVAGTIAKTRDTSLDQLTNEDVRLPIILSSYWDTLGWVRSQQGNLPEAEKYIRCSWQIRSIGVIGDHLAQIYEKEGRKAEAIQTYAAALASPDPPVETKRRLSALLGNGVELDEAIRKSAADLPSARAIPLPNRHNLQGAADFWLLLGPEPLVRGVKFASGDEILKPLSSELESLKLPDYFPEATDCQILRKAKLACSSSFSPQCTLLFLSAEAVRLNN
jgi:tetratricopeptide (TPR) repeat protein